MDIYGLPTPTTYSTFLNIKHLQSAWVAHASGSSSIWVTACVYTCVFEFLSIW
jgi:hypothetical protein